MLPMCQRARQVAEIGCGAGVCGMDRFVEALLQHGQRRAIPFIEEHSDLVPAALPGCLQQQAAACLCLIAAVMKKIQARHAR
ncbi:hypothetical protein JJB74_01670 [Noviherbaspirillum sp. DKR-6]|uniref:Uncharacterized protein n=1 Tax=Noviherbaspirillum pedocola TaxID=2801341 RepID=A0A934W6B1_9BURK|nr:hypothetical protein [Noviherbaspirillum pedocola]